MVVLTNVSLQFDGQFERLEHAIRKAQGIANLWTITIWMKPFETSSVFDQDNRPLFDPDGRALVHFKGATHRNEILVWGERIENETSEEFIVVEKAAEKDLGKGTYFVEADSSIDSSYIQNYFLK